jgi:hypothetical protein
MRLPNWLRRKPAQEAPPAGPSPFTGQGLTAPPEPRHMRERQSVKRYEGERRGPKRNGITIQCLHCGKDVYVRPSRIKMKRKYCGNECYRASGDLARNGKKGGHHSKAKNPTRPERKSKPNCTCVVCGTEFYRRPSHIARGEGKYCSRECVMVSGAYRVGRLGKGKNQQ